jgi:N-methylhydantoinase A
VSNVRALGVDVGGTFTDIVMWDGERLQTAKTSTTPDQSDGVVSGAGMVGGQEADRFLHGTTVATNALLERKGAPTALITTEGFADVIEIARQDRPSLYDSAVDRAEALVPRHRRFEAPRNRPTLDRQMLEAVAASGDAVAVSLLYGYASHDEESAIASKLEEIDPSLAIAISSEVAPEFREYERTSTAVLNAYLMPAFGTYLRHLVDRAAAAGLPPDIAVMRSSGGLLPIATGADLPVAALLSGPAGGVVAAAALGEVLGKTSLISFDMGGTSTDVCRIENGRPEIAYGREIGGYACLQPSAAIHTVGAGGGSIAWVDSGGSLRVGPQSAGASPGPAGYGRGGGDSTVTDANIALGRIDPAGSLPGGLSIRAELADRALTVIGGLLGLDVTDTALGVASVVEEVMAGALRVVSIEQGADPRDATLVAFGGAGGLHATALARALDMGGVAVPAHAGVFSALGLLLSQPRVDEARSVLLRIDDAELLDAAVERVMSAASRALADDGGEVGGYVDTRYVGQAHEVAVPYRPGDGWSALARRFHALHHERNGFARPDDAIEAVTVRAEALGPAALTWADLPEPEPEGEHIVGTRDVLSADGPVQATVHSRIGLRPGDEVLGPAIVEDSGSTTYLAPGDRGTVHGSGALEIEW